MLESSSSKLTPTRRQTFELKDRFGAVVGGFDENIKTDVIRSSFAPQDLLLLDSNFCNIDNESREMVVNCLESTSS